MRTFIRIISLCLSLCLMLCAFTPAAAQDVLHSSGTHWHLGFGCATIEPPAQTDQPLYIAGYQSGWEISGVLDPCQARALWLDTGDAGILLIGVDCIALASGTVKRIRQALSDIPGCAAINVYATHTHAGVDTLGLWGPMGVDGKNDDYMDALVSAACAAARAAAADRRAGELRLGAVKTQNMYRDSRIPPVCDENLYQLRFIPDDASAGTRLFLYGAHAESLRGDNTLLSRDFPGLLCDQVSAATSDHTMFAPGAIGGLIMTREFLPIRTQQDAIDNLNRTAELLTQYALSIDPAHEKTLSPSLSFSREVFSAALDNPAFLLYKFLGILQNSAVRAQSATGYAVETELCLLKLDGIALALIPGEIFPELVSGDNYGDANRDGVNPRPLADIAADYGVSQLLIIGLCNDEIGYIVPPSDFMLHPRLPYLNKTMDYKGENHYEETNSVGPACAHAIAQAFEAALGALE